MRYGLHLQFFLTWGWVEIFEQFRQWLAMLRRTENNRVQIEIAHFCGVYTQLAGVRLGWDAGANWDPSASLARTYCVIDKTLVLLNPV